MSVMASWGSHQFIVSPNRVNGFSDITIKKSSETENKTSGSEQFVSRKNEKAAEITITATLNANLGSKVQEETSAYLDAAGKGESDYLYIGGKKLIAGKLMLTDATITSVGLAPSGKWTTAKIQLTFKQSTKGDGSTSTGGGGSSSSGKKKKKKKSKTYYQIIADHNAGKFKNPAQFSIDTFHKISQFNGSNASSSIPSAKAQIARITNAAKKNSIIKARNKAKKKVGR